MNKKTIKLTENELYNIIKESVKSIIIESKGIKSKKFYDIISKHGGIKSNRGIFDLHNLTDNDFISLVNYSELRDFENKGSKRFAQQNGIDLEIADTIDFIPLNDGMYILAVLRGGKYDRISKKINNTRNKQNGDFEFLANKKIERMKNRHPRKNDYVWNNRNAEEVFKNPFFRKGDGNWTPERKKQVMNNVRSGKNWFDNE